jgi:hypothetical protein
MAQLYSAMTASMRKRPKRPPEVDPTRPGTAAAAPSLPKPEGLVARRRRGPMSALFGRMMSV